MSRASSLSRVTSLSLSSTAIVLVQFGLFLVETINFSVNSSSCHELGYANSHLHSHKPLLALRSNRFYFCRLQRLWEQSQLFLQLRFHFLVRFPTAGTVGEKFTAA